MTQHVDLVLSVKLKAIEQFLHWRVLRCKERGGEFLEIFVVYGEVNGM